MCRRIIILLIINFLFFVSFGYSQENEDKLSTMNSQQAMEYIAKMNLKQRSEQEKALEAIKAINPKKYEEIRKLQESAKEIDKITSDFYSGKIGIEKAEKQLYPLVKKQIEESRAGIDIQITILKKQLRAFEEMKVDPDLAAKNQVDLLLGRVPLINFYPQTTASGGVNLDKKEPKK